MTVPGSVRRAALPGAGLLALLLGLALAPLARTAEAPPIFFVDRAAAAGLDFEVTYGGRGQNKYILETTGTGAAFLDFDRDSRLDVFLVNGTTLEAGSGPGCALFRNQGDGRFENVTGRAGLTCSGWGQGVAVADYDNDGYPDLYLTFFGRNILFHNEGNGTFKDVTDKAGVAGGGWSTSASFGDYDRDGRLDLYVARYVDFDLPRAPLPGSQPNCFYGGFPVMCGPRGLPGQRDLLFHNEGNGTFRDVTDQAGIDRDKLRGLGVVFGDYDDDSWPDILVANDAHPNLLYHNNHDGTFAEVAFEAGVAFDDDGRERAGMGVDMGDYDNDGRLDVVITNFQGEPNALYHNVGHGLFAETTWTAGLGEATLRYLGWGTGFVDFDNDGWVDLFFVNGHVYPEVERHRLDETYAQRALVFRNLGEGRFGEVSSAAGADLAKPRPGRGAAFGDYDEDGRVDVLVTAVNDRVALLHNEGAAGRHWLSVHLVGQRSNRDGIGARVTLEASGLRQLREVHGGSSYLSQSDLRAHFGLGSSPSASSLEVRWPSGARDRLENVAGDRTIVIVEGRGLVAGEP